MTSEPRLFLKLEAFVDGDGNPHSVVVSCSKPDRYLAKAAMDAALEWMRDQAYDFYIRSQDLTDSAAVTDEPAEAMDHDRDIEKAIPITWKNKLGL